MISTLRDAAQAAIDMQDACNASGVIHTLSEIMPIIRAATRGTDQTNTHPIVVLVLDKLCDLARMDHFSAANMDQYRAALDACRQLAEQPATPQPPDQEKE